MNNTPEAKIARQIITILRESYNLSADEVADIVDYIFFKVMQNITEETNIVMLIENIKFQIVNIADNE
jgi:hypothetical protein